MFGTLTAILPSPPHPEACAWYRLNVVRVPRRNLCSPSDLHGYYFRREMTTCMLFASMQESLTANRERLTCLSLTLALWQASGSLAAGRTRPLDSAGGQLTCVARPSCSASP